MTQQHSTPRAAASQRGKQTHFLSTVTRYGDTDTDPKMGHHGIQHTVLVFAGDEVLPAHPVVLCLANEGFGLQEYLTPSEARTLAEALTMAADHADSVELDHDIDAAMAAAGVAA
jgi:hypothetical protein